MLTRHVRSWTASGVPAATAAGHAAAFVATRSDRRSMSPSDGADVAAADVA